MHTTGSQGPPKALTATGAAFSEPGNKQPAWLPLPAFSRAVGGRKTGAQLHGASQGHGVVERSLVQGTVLLFCFLHLFKK